MHILLKNSLRISMALVTQSLILKLQTHSNIPFKMFSIQLWINRDGNRCLDVFSWLPLPWKFIQIADLTGCLPGSLDNEQANSTLSHMSLKSEIQSIKENKHSTEMFWVFDQRKKFFTVNRNFEKKKKKKNYWMAEK